MNILIVKMRFPYPILSGTDLVSFNLIRALSEEHEITLLCHVRSEENIKDVPELKKYCKDVIFVRYPNPSNILSRMWRKFKREFLLFFCLIPREVSDYTSKAIAKELKTKLRDNKFDIVQMEYFFAGKYEKYIKDAVKILLSNDAFFITSYQLFKYEKNIKKKIVRFFEYLATRRYEFKMYKKFDWVFFISKRDEEVIKNYMPTLKKTKVIPVSFDLSDDVSNYEIEQKSLVFVGGMKAEFNIDAMSYFCYEILPIIEKKISDVKLYIVGESPGEKTKSLSNRGNVVVTGTVADVKPFIKRGQVYVAPLRVGTGIKTKIIEALALGKPIVTTSIGVQGIEAENGKHLIIADDPNKFAEETINLLISEQIRETLSANAKQLFLECYDFKSVKEIVKKQYRGLSP